MLNTEQHNFILNNRLDMSIMDIHRELGVSLTKLRNHMKDENLMISKEAIYAIKAKNRAKKPNIIPQEMKYEQELKMKLKEINAKLVSVHKEIISMQKKREDITEALQRRNILSVDKDTIKSRLFNLGKEAYITPIFTINN